ncbi:hypothetical protein AVMA1855_20080 [Acidovorax sp. SUPP1855]|uniref:hypothetical protein n=1 Tax=Acidovorax sp. SUPP1855 TaxID=431774 RepID=UPI0023DE5A12|nr:hypothetical protein [Acidovorax sp. SUPP1855]GKS86490.1 hypothetical protein AVMA1855_20080 [Acidovorax sp. SUPP1855]
MTIEATLSERGSRYGDFADHAAIAQQIQDVMRASAGWARLNAVQKQALTVIADKQARILSGDPNYSDNWHDMQGYAKLVEDRLPAQASPMDLPTIQPGITFDNPEPHDELRKTWRPSQLWQFHADGVWHECICEPAWHYFRQYRRHPDDKDESAQ